MSTLTQQAQAHRPDFFELSAQEPRLERLLAEVRALNIERPRNYCRMGFFFGYPGCPRPSIKAQLSTLVGWNARTNIEALTTSEAFEEVYQYLLGQMPACSCCG